MSFTSSDWESLTSIENLKAAYYYARANFFRESFIDVTQIRLFDTNLEERLRELQARLWQTDPSAVRLDDSINFYFPKNATNSRLRASLRLEAEILSVAVVLYLRQSQSLPESSSYAYRLNETEQKSEYLYESWFTAYRRFLDEARIAAMKHPDGRVIRTDIESFYANIVQSRLVELIDEDSLIDSRARWALELLLQRNLDGHREGMGLVQGSIGSGFFANIYLSAVDRFFAPGNSRRVEFFRYVDDMILIVPEAEDEKSVINDLHYLLSSLGLNVNLEKTESLSVTEFLTQTEPDQQLESLNRIYYGLLDAIWVMNPEYRQIFQASIRNDTDWWGNIRIFQRNLQSLGIYEREDLLSRQVVKHLEPVIF